MKSFRVFLHGNHLIAILANHTRLVGSARVLGSRVRNVSITARNVQGIVPNIGGDIRWTFRRYRYNSVFPSVRDLFKDVLPDSPKIAVINLTIIFILPPFPGRGISRSLASIAVAETLLISTNSCLLVHISFKSLQCV